MRKFTVSLEYLLPVWKSIAILAKDPADACRKAIDLEDWEGSKEDYESAGATYVTAIAKGDQCPYSVSAEESIEVPAEFTKAGIGA